jgi:foldase protein PrsA
MKKKIFLKGSYRLLFPVTLFLLFVISCSQQNDHPENMVAQVNDSYLNGNQVEYHIPQGLDDEMAFALKKEIISKWVNNEVIYQAALGDGFKLNDKESFFVEEYRKALLVQRYLDSKLDKDYSVSRQDLEAYYEKNRQEFVRKEDEVHIIHLLMEHQDNAIFREISNADDLLALIKKYFFDQKSTKVQPNDDLGYVPLSNLPDIFVRTLRRMNTGSISNPIKTDQGYHFLQLLDSEKKGTVRDLELVKNQIIVRLKQERREAEMDRLLNAAKGESQIQTYLSKIQK